MPNTPVPAGATGLPENALANVQDCLVLALDIADNQCPFPDEACDLLREALGEVKALIDRPAAPHLTAA